ncbi:class I SAM-dependent methyltransferase [Thalassospira marina]|uniref:Methyltransferase n=1 Tax=Thalassospira marina TaxID=2048283 RepID=A0ABM6QAB9_9PROT|nr:class I SAM-dependent methyltransferase [Thalassospira marina]AUG53474.1 methyltransferase [Thalassospira marina]
MTQTPFKGTAAQNYNQGPPRQVPGFDGLHKMSSQLLAERMPDTGRLLVLGAGGGLELEMLADQHAGWRFDGVDPSADMLALARETVVAHESRVSLHHGYIDDAPDGPFDGALCLLTFHFIARDQRLPTLKSIHSRMRKGAPLVLAHISFPQEEPERSLWIARHVAFAGTSPDKVEAACEAIATRLTILSPQEEEAMLREAGFENVSLFYAGLSFKGWVAYAGA